MERKYLDLEFIKPIPRDVRKIVRSMVAIVNITFPVLDYISVKVTPSYVVGDEESGYGFAAFQVCDGKIEIFLAGHPLPDITYKEWLDCLKESLCHELAHYEQYRDKKPLQERGVRVRARSLLRSLGWRD